MSREIEYIIIDVDGTMTDAGIYYDELGNEIKKFCTKDAAGFFVAKNVGIKIIVLTGRECKATSRRMEELKVDSLFQGIKDKTTFLKDYFERKNIKKNQVAYIGDDLNDLKPMSLVGFVGCPYDACEEVKEIADYISIKKGGCGVVTDVIKHILCASEEWDDIINDMYSAGI